MGGEADYLFKKSFFSENAPIKTMGRNEIYTSIQNISKNLSSEFINRYDNVSEVLYIFSFLTDNRVSREAAKYSNYFLQRVVAEIEYNPERILEVNELAKIANIHRSYLHKLFVKEIGMSPRQYIIDYKLRRCAKMLIESKTKTQDIFLSVGFPSYHVASEEFRKKYGITPKEYRIKYQTDRDKNE